MAGRADTGPTFEPDGTVRVPSFALPVSGLVSAEAAAAQGMRAAAPSFDAAGQEPDIAVRREQVNAYAAQAIPRLRESFAVEIVHTAIGGVPVLDVMPANRSPDPARVLVNLHGGAFTVGWDGIAHIETIPMAVLAGYRIVSVDYRMAPEHRHPAGVADGAAVYAANDRDLRWSPRKVQRGLLCTWRHVIHAYSL